MPMAVAEEEELSRCFYVFELLDTAKITNAIKLTSMAEFYIGSTSSHCKFDLRRWCKSRRPNDGPKRESRRSSDNRMKFPLVLDIYIF